MAGWVTRYSPPRHPPSHTPPGTTPGTPLPALPSCTMVTAVLPLSNMAVGLKSVGQLSLDARFSGFQGMTEVYNLSKIDRINNH